ncbi:MAG: hypothetical protein R3F49_07865 [Planctomycetota bacterium]
MQRLLSRCLASAAAGLSLLPIVRAQTCAELQTFGVAGGWVTVTDVSSDGQVLVGYSSTGQAFRWTAAAGRQDLGALPNDPWSVATAVSADGSVVVGYSASVGVGSRRAFLWTAAGGMQDLGGLTTPPLSTEALAVSADGTVVVGTSNGHAFRWSAATGMLSLGTPTLGSSACAVGVSADGSVVVVREAYDVGFPVPTAIALRWTAMTGLVSLGNDYWPVAISGDGEVIVANGPNSAGSRAYRWTQAGGWGQLPGLASSSGSAARDISEDGRVIVGQSERQIIPGSPIVVGTPVRWTVEEGLADLTVSAGLDPSMAVAAVSGDGTVLAGLGPNSEGFRVRVSALGTTYCRPAVANSGTCSGVLLIEGRPTAAAGTLQLIAELLPQNAPGYFLTSRAQAQVVGPGGSQGNLCLGNGIGRFVGPGQVQNSGAARRFSLAVDLTALPTPSGLIPSVAGETWNFQAWYRDANPGPTSNFTDAVSVTLQ